MVRWGAHVDRRLADLERASGPGMAGVFAHARKVAGDRFRADTPPPAVAVTVDGEVAYTWHRHGIEAGLYVDADAADAWYYDPLTGYEWASSAELHWGCCVYAVLLAVAGRPQPGRGICLR